jgi:hypothetical protein
MEIAQASWKHGESAMSVLQKAEAEGSVPKGVEPLF